ncbi:unnamed protein product [Phytophthora lilii]|uniref:Unnamed protein product n=1 Tax=Phytophthora lilii TaxID=2077276 RepID=A0A9W6TB59_9STRA|nr:unnamed protein product [Phytophthora lilii]
MWLRLKTDPKAVFNLLNLGRAGKKLDDNTQLVRWFKYVTTYKTQKTPFYDRQIYKLLSGTAVDTALALLFILLEQPAWAHLDRCIEKLRLNGWADVDRHLPSSSFTFMNNSHFEIP